MKTKIKVLLILFIIPLLYFSCAEKKDPFSITTHPEGWNSPSSSNFHGLMVLESNVKATNCQSCHGIDYSGGSSNISCSAEGCHNLYPHPPGYADSLSENFHSENIASSIAWDITKCQSCHGQDYDGIGFNKKNCLTCHSEPNGPEDCKTCHGNRINGAPPEDLAGNTNTTFIGVGAHQQHLVDTTWTTAYQQDCFLCHIEPVNYTDPGHIDNTPLPAEINFSFIASDSGLSNPSWNHDEAKCNNIYCHGAFVFERDSSANSWAYSDSLMTGNNPEMIWTLVGTGQDVCESCHGLPPQGHTAATTCNGCHPKVVDVNYNIIDKSLHINGKKDVF
jgi:hypothetical protein